MSMAGRPPSLVREHPCPTCKAGAGEPCALSGRYHAARYHAAGETPPKGGARPAAPPRQRQVEVALPRDVVDRIDAVALARSSSRADVLVDLLLGALDSAEDAARRAPDLES